MPDKKTDPGERAAKRAEAEIEEKIKGVYGTAAKELKEKLGSLEKAYADRLAKKQKELAEGKITQDELKAWVRSQLLRQKQVKDQIDQCTGVLLHANEKALGIVNQEQLGVFAENANFQEYQINRDTGLNLMFSVYDEHSVERLIRDNPDMLPPKMVNGKKDKAWNQTRITSAVTQAIIQGESIPALAKRIAAESAGGNAAAMMRYARTAMTAAQNAGRVEMLHRAQGLGVKCRKRWMATLDSRTRDSHQEMDGEVVGVDDEFSNGLLYPGDPNGAPGEVYNCRCTMTYEYDGIDNALQERMAYNEWDDVHYTTEKDKLGREYQKKHVIHHRTGEMIEYKTYSEWKKRNAPVPEAAGTNTDDRSELGQKLDDIASRHVVQGEDITGTWQRRLDEFAFEIEDVINAQGFDGLPRLMDPEDFDKAVKESGFIAQRSYSATGQDTLDSYRDMLYNGKFYVDCSTGGAQYGQGMYCAADYTGTLTDGIKEEMQHYRKLNEERQGNTQRDYAQELYLQEVKKVSIPIDEKYREALTDEFGITDHWTKGKPERQYVKDWIENNPDEAKRLKKELEEGQRRGVEKGTEIEKMSKEEFKQKFPNKVPISYTETFTLTPDAKIITYNELEQERTYGKIEQRIYESMEGTLSPPQAKIIREWIKSDGEINIQDKKTLEIAQDIEERAEILMAQDPGAYAAMLGYDAINAENHGDSGSYTVILNRTKCIFRRDAK